MPLTKEYLQTYRARTFCTGPGLRLASAEEAVDFVNQRGFVLFWPMKNLLKRS